MIRRMRYPGGKGGSFRRLINLMPPHDIYIESHLGGGAVMRNKRPAARSIGVEIDDRVMARWRTLNIDWLELVQGDAHAFLRTFPFTGRELVFCDPPFLRETRRAPRVYRHDYTTRDHEELLKILNDLDAKVMVCGYPSALYDEALADWHATDITVASQVGRRGERIWTNFEPPAVPFDLAFAGETFRERERLNRRHERLTGRIAKLGPIERARLVTWLRDHYPDLGLPRCAACP